MGPRVIASESRREGATLPILHALQAAFGYIHAEAVPMIAETLNLTRAEVHGVVTFYHEFRRHPPGRHVLRLCRAEACQSMGADALAAHVRRRLGVDWHDTTADGAVTLEPVFCLGPVRDRRRRRCWMARRWGGSTTRGSTALERARVTRVFVPRDAAALALGADAVASLLAQAGDVEVVRTGSRGLFWLEPMVEVATAEGRIAYGPVSVADISGLLAAGMLAGGAHPLRLGPPETIPYLAEQTRLTFARCGVVDPLSLDDYRAHGGLAGLERAREIGPGGDDRDWSRSPACAAAAARVSRPASSGRPPPRRTGRAQVHRLQRRRGRLRHLCRPDADGRRSVRADRGHGDRRFRGRRDEGLRIYALGISARDRDVRRGAGDRAREAGIAGRAAFDIEQRVGAGAYVCGEETSLLESLEGRRGQVRAKPPLPAHKGLFGAPTVINNVITLATRAGHPARRRGGLSGAGHGPVARHDADPVGRQHPVWRAVRGRVRPDPRRTRE